MTTWKHSAWYSYTCWQFTHVHLWFGQSVLWEHEIWNLTQSATLVASTSDNFAFTWIGASNKLVEHGLDNRLWTRSLVFSTPAQMFKDKRNWLIMHWGRRETKQLRSFLSWCRWYQPDTGHKEHARSFAALVIVSITSARTTRDAVWNREDWVISCEKDVAGICHYLQAGKRSGKPEWSRFGSDSYSQNLVTMQNRRHVDNQKPRNKNRQMSSGNSHVRGTNLWIFWPGILTHFCWSFSSYPWSQTHSLVSSSQTLPSGQEGVQPARRTMLF